MGYREINTIIDSSGQKSELFGAVRRSTRQWGKVSGKLSKCDFVIKALIDCGFDTLPYGWDMERLVPVLWTKNVAKEDEIDIFSRRCTSQRWCMEKQEALWGSMMALEMSIWRQMLYGDHNCGCDYNSSWAHTWVLVLLSNILTPEGSCKLTKSCERQSKLVCVC